MSLFRSTSLFMDCPPSYRDLLSSIIKGVSTFCIYCLYVCESGCQRGKNLRSSRLFYGFPPCHRGTSSLALFRESPLSVFIVCMCVRVCVREGKILRSITVLCFSFSSSSWSTQVLYDDIDFPLCGLHQITVLELIHVHRATQAEHIIDIDIVKQF